MGLFILTAESVGSVMKVVLWCIAPVVTAWGFARGVYTLERRSGERQTSFVSVLVWPLLGCVVGALVVVWWGPMLIVFGMFVAGTAGVVLREVIVRVRQNQDHKTS